MPNTEHKTPTVRDVTDIAYLVLERTRFFCKRNCSIKNDCTGHIICPILTIRTKLNDLSHEVI